MKWTSSIVRALVLVGLTSFALSTNAGTIDTGTVYAGKYRVVKDGKLIVYTETTASRIPERVVLYGQHPNSASNMYVVQGKDLLRTGATSVLGILSLDPSVGSSRGRGM